MKSVRDKAKESNSNDKYDKLKFGYLEISSREYMMSTKTKDVENMKKMAKKKIDSHIKDSKNMNYDELVSLCENVQQTKREVRASENLWSRWGKFGEKAEFVYSEYDRLINALKEEISKKKKPESN